jgi:hypothetical protein
MDGAGALPRSPTCVCRCARPRPGRGRGAVATVLPGGLNCTPGGDQATLPKTRVSVKGGIRRRQPDTIGPQAPQLSALDQGPLSFHRTSVTTTETL